MSGMITCDVLVMAHNEAANIGSIVSSVLDQKWTRDLRLGSCIVVSTVSTDATDQIVESLAAQDPRVRLFTIPDRRGKVVDVNLGIAQSLQEVLVIMDADIDISPACLPELLAPFQDPGVGLTTPTRAVADAPRVTTAWRVGRLIAEIHNNLASPKAGQVLAIRREIAAVAEDVTVDDAFQQWRAGSLGMKVVRVPTAVVTSRPPRTFREYVSQRRRVVAQYRTLQQVTGFVPDTQSVRKVAAAALRTPTVASERRWNVVCAGALAEAVARSLGWFDARCTGRDYRTWEPVASTKAP